MCPSVRLSFRPYVRTSGRPSVRPSVRLCLRACVVRWCVCVAGGGGWPAVVRAVGALAAADEHLGCPYAPHARTHARTHARKHARTHAHARSLSRARTHTHLRQNKPSPRLPPPRPWPHMPRGGGAREIAAASPMAGPCQGRRRTKPQLLMYGSKNCKENFWRGDGGALSRAPTDKAATVNVRIKELQRKLLAGRWRGPVKGADGQSRNC